MIEIDGSVMEGVNYYQIELIVHLLIFILVFLWFEGGQILRIAIALSALVRKPIKITKIRAGRKKGGLAAQHLNGNNNSFVSIFS